MSRFEERRADLARAWAIRSGDNDVPALGLLALAEGLAEVIALLRPLVDTVTAQPEPLTLRTDAAGGMPCLAGDPGSNGFRRCMEPYGHDRDHRHRDGLNRDVEYAWTQRHGDVPKPDPCGCVGPQIGVLGADGRYVCALDAGHTGLHTEGEAEVMW